MPQREPWWGGPFRAKKASAVVGTGGTIFKVQGEILLLALRARVMTAMSATVTTLTFAATPTGGAAENLALATAVTSDALNTRYSLPGDKSGSVQKNTVPNAVGAGGGGRIIPAGTITATYSASQTGAVEYEAFYLPLTRGAGLVAA
jgi:hypothetical protein